MKKLTTEDIKKLKAEQDANRRPWSVAENNLMQQLVAGGVVSSKLIVAKGFFPDRTIKAIQNKIREFKVNIHEKTS